MESLIKKINMPDFNEYIFHKIQSLKCNSNEDKNTNSVKIDKIGTFNEIKNIPYDSRFIFKTPIKSKNINLGNNNDVFEKIKFNLSNEEASYSYIKKITKLFQNLIEYLLLVKKNRELMRNYEKFGKFLIKRIKIKDAEDFINYKYKNSKPSTKANIKSSIRKFIRLINDEPKLDFNEKILRPKTIANNSLLSKDELFLFLNELNEKNDIQSLVLFYLLYFVGLNYSFVSRLVSKNFKSSFKLLIIKKGTKVIKHYFSPVITELLFKYFIDTRSYDSSYFFFDDIKENRDKTRTSIIKEKVKEILDKTNHFNEYKKNKILAQFSKLRRAKIITRELYEYFIIPDLWKEEKKENEDKTFSDGEKFQKNNFDGLIESNLLPSKNDIDEKYFSFDEDGCINQNFDADSIRCNLNSLWDERHLDDNYIDEPLATFLKRKTSKSKNFKSKKKEKDLSGVISESFN